MKNTAILLLTCPDRKGVVAAIADFIYRHNGNILHADEHGDLDSGMFQMRVEFDPADFSIDLAEFSKPFSPIAEKFEMNWRLAQSSYRPRMIILVSKHDHCLVDLLYRHKSGELACDIPLIISNHPDNQPIAEFYCIPYITVPVPKDNKCEAEQKILDGAKPYHQAFARGVKLIGATSHYVTEVLDDGPIIEQDVVRISHRDSLDDLLQKGRDLEKVVLSRAVRWHIENRVLLYGNKTVVFD